MNLLYYFFIKEVKTLEKVVITIIFLLVISPFIFSDTDTLDPIADAPLFENSPGTNYGSQIYGYWGCYSGGGQRTLLKYDLSGITGTITGVQLSWHCMQNDGGTGDMWACLVTGGDWDEYSVTWNTQPAHDDSESSRLLDIPWDDSEIPITHDCTSYAIGIIQGWVDDPGTNYGMILKKDPESGNTPRCYPYMKESTEQPVQLIVEYTDTNIESTSMGHIKALFE
jgi:hypothetical protein